MTDDELERLLGDAFDAQARASVGDGATPPTPRFAHADDPVHGRAAHRRRRRRHALAPLAAAAAVVAVAGGAFAATQALGHEDHPQRHAAAPRPHRSAVAPAPTTTRGTGPSRTATSSHARPAAVHVKLLNEDGAQYGVGMPVIAYFSRAITDGRALQKATTVSVDGHSAQAAWYFERSAAGHGPVEAHLRLRDYWPAHAKVHVALPIQGRSAGAGLVYDNDLTLDFATGADTQAVVSDTAHRMTVTRDGHVVGRYPVSLGARNTPTAHGTKVIMEKGRSICMSGPGYRECGIKYTQRLTYGGEYLHAAPWNVANIKAGVDSSNGCTNLLPDDARTLYKTFEVGDVVRYPGTDGPAMSLGAGYGDWNVDWGTWLGGGLVRTH